MRRRLARVSPKPTIVVILTLGLGIGANTAIFSLMDQVLLRSLNVQDPAALVQLDGPGPFSGRTLDDRRRREGRVRLERAPGIASGDSPLLRGAIAHLSEPVGLPTFVSVSTVNLR
jgi:hypothetical protein